MSQTIEPKTDISPERRQSRRLIVKRSRALEPMVLMSTEDLASHEAWGMSRCVTLDHPCKVESYLRRVFVASGEAHKNNYADGVYNCANIPSPPLWRCRPLVALGTYASACFRQATPYILNIQNSSAGYYRRRDHDERMNLPGHRVVIRKEAALERRLMDPPPT